MGSIQVPAHSVVTAAKREGRWVDIFVGAAGEGVLTNWVVGHGSWNEWIRLLDGAYGDGFTVPDRAWVMPVRRGNFHTTETESHWVADSSTWPGHPDPYHGYGGGGNPYGHGHPYGGGSYSPGGHYVDTSVTVEHGQEDIFVVGRDGGVYTNWVVDHREWNGWLRLTDPDFDDGFIVPLSAVVWPIKRDEYQEDVFVVGHDGRVYTNYVVGNDPWSGWQSISGALRAKPGSVVSAVKRDEDQEDIFVVDQDGGVYTNWVTNHDPWNQWIRISDPAFEDQFTVAPGSAVWPCKRDDDQLDIFVVGRDGTVFTNWVSHHGQWNQWLAIPGNPSPPSGSVVTAVKRDDHQEDIFVAGEGGEVYTSLAVDHDPWTNWAPAGNPGPTVAAGSVVWPLLRDDDQLDIYVVAEDGGVYTKYVVGHGNWSDWIQL